MSRLKIKDPMRKKKKTKEPLVSLRTICERQLQIERTQIKEKDDDEVEELVEKKILKKDGSYKHVKNVARDLEWSTSRVYRSLDRLAHYEKIQEQIKKRIQAEMKKANNKETVNEENTEDKNTQD